MDAIKKYKRVSSPLRSCSHTGIIKSIQGLKGVSPSAIADQFFTKIIRPDSPERLKSLFKAIDNPEEIRSALASRYLDDAFRFSKTHSR
jgi:DNA-binding transcriptional regulator YdaS (Cro superfamily)